MSDIDPDAYVRENKDTLVDVIKHSDDEFTRALAIIVLRDFGDDPNLDDVERELEAAREVAG
jgi:hypothetical protein